jgi:pimeloyl-ACP methyl ester carboxylesterase
MTVERPLLFGSNDALMGILSLPEPVAAASPSVAVLLFNSGVVQRVGPHRINVKVARALSECGVPTLRFDLAGRGDSRIAAPGGDYRCQASADISDAMDCVKRKLGISRFILIGFCSGAIDAFRAAETDKRVAGLLLFDGHWHRTIWTKPMRYWFRFRTIGFVRSVKAAIRRIHASNDMSGRAAIGNAGWSGQPTKEEFAASLDEMVRRRVAVLILYSGVMINEGLYTYKAQFGHAFRGRSFVDAVRVDLRPDLDHTLGSLHSQREFVAMVAEWISGLLYETRVQE